MEKKNIKWLRHSMFSPKICFVGKPLLISRSRERVLGLGLGNSRGRNPTAKAPTMHGEIVSKGG